MSLMRSRFVRYNQMVSAEHLPNIAARCEGSWVHEKIVNDPWSF